MNYIESTTIQRCLLRVVANAKAEYSNQIVDFGGQQVTDEVASADATLMSESAESSPAPSLKR